VTLSEKIENVLWKSVILLLVMAVPALASCQKPSAPPPAPRPSAPPPAPRPSAPAAPRPSAPAARPNTSAQRPTAPARPAAQTRPGTTAQRPGTVPTKTPARSKPTVGNKPTVPTKSSGGPKPGTNRAGPGTKTTGPVNRPSAVKQVALRSGGTAQLRSNGQVRSIDKNGMHIEHNLHGGRTVVSEHNGKRIVTNGKQGGYVQHAYVNRGGHSYYARTSYAHGAFRSGVYRGYSYGGHVYYGYQPGFYYHPAFYAWGYNPWPGPVYWGVGAWGWAGAPWYGYYGFTPYASYAGPAFWLTDYLIAANLQAAYAAQAESPAGGVLPGIQVAANQPWNDTGTQLIQRQTYTITASGVANYGPGNVSPAGIGPTGCLPNPVAPGLSCASLVGKIGPSGIPFYVGPTNTFVAPVSGELYLSMNDNYFADNSGAWQVSISPAGGSAVVAGGMPMRIVENENSSVYASDFVGDSPVWAFNGMQGTGQFGTGLQPMTVEKFDGSTIIVRRRDTSGNWRGSALYVGQIQGNIITGQVTYFNPNGATRNGGWHGRIDSWALPAGGDASAVSVAATGSDPVVLTPEAKEAIAGEVKAQLRAEQDAATQPAAPAGQRTAQRNNELPPALDPARRTFVVSADLAVATVPDGQECALTEGDAILRITDTPDKDQKVNVSVSATKKTDCAAGKMVAVSVDDLQEMRNHFQEQLDDGMKAMAAKQGTGGMPRAPDTTTVASSLPTPPADKTAVKDLQDQQAAADQTEAEVRQETAGASVGGEQ
jgi:hypothetical protein